MFPTTDSNSDKLGVIVVEYLYFWKSRPFGSIRIGILYLFANLIIKSGLTINPLA